MIESLGGDGPAMATENLGAESRFDTPLGQLARSRPVTCPPQLPVREAVQRMHVAKVGSIVVVDDHDRPLGIFTLHDLRALIAGRGDLDAAIAHAMTPDPACLGSADLAFEAVLLMARRHIRHVVVTDGGRVAGVVSERDLFALQRINVVHLMRAIADARSVPDLIQARSAIHGLIDAMLAHGAGVEQMTRIITLLNDRTVIRVIELCLEAEGDPGVAFTWVAFGSEGRSEQTLVTDQDNGILFDPGDDDVVAVRQRLLPLARRINEALHDCGFPLCKGNIMASNPKLCLSLAEWENTFRGIIASSTPENLLRSSIYFDFRPIWGDVAVAEDLHQRVLQAASGSSLFLHMMARNALINRPPLGMVRDFVTERHEGERVETLDLKMGGLTPFVDGARLLSLEGRLPPTNTLERLRASAAAGMATAAEAQAWGRSFAYIQMLRMRLHQLQARDGLPLSNRLDPATLNPMDRHILREAFRQARALQRKLELRYHV
jgi:CBS domain-containing protein